MEASTAASPSVWFYLAVGLFSLLNLIVSVYAIVKLAEWLGWYFGFPLLLAVYLVAGYLLLVYWQMGLALLTVSVWLFAIWQWRADR